MCRSVCSAASDLPATSAKRTIREWKTVAIDEASRRGRRAARLGRLPLGRKGKWNLEEKDADRVATSSLLLSLIPTATMTRLPRSASPISATEHDHFKGPTTRTCWCAGCR